MAGVPKLKSSVIYYVDIFFIKRNYSARIRQIMIKKILIIGVLIFLCGLGAVYFSLPKDLNKPLYKLLSKYSYNGSSIERIQLKKTDIAIRQKNTLKIKVKTGKVVTLKDDLTEGWSTYRKFSLIYWFKDIHYVLICCDFYEGGEWLLISDQTGQITSINSPPLFSPDTKRFIVSNFDEAGFSESGISIYRINSKALVKEWANANNAEDAKWVSNTKIQYMRTTYEPHKRRLAILEQRDGKWVEISNSK